MMGKWGGGRGYPILFDLFIFHVVCLSLVFTHLSGSLRMMGKLERGREVPVPLFPLSNVTYLSLVSQPMARDPFFSLKPATQPPHFILYSKQASNQGSNQASKQHLRKEIEGGLEDLKADLLRVASWCCSNRLLINPDKTKFCVFGSSKMLGQVTIPPLTFMGKDLHVVDSVKDLGVILDKRLSFNEHVDTL